MTAVTCLEICTLMGFFCPKHIKFYMKKYRGAIVLWDGRVMQRKANSWETCISCVMQ